MRLAPTDLVPPCLLAALLAAGCAPAGPRPYVPQAANALPQQDPSSRGTAQGQQLPLTAYEQVVVRMGRDPGGQPVVLQVLSPALTPEQQEEVRRAFGLGEWKRQVPVATEAETWIETIVRNK
jgi:hypothetical protein